MAEAVIRVEGLSKRFGGITALNNVTLDMRRGEVAFIVGPNGSGKTTLVNVISRYVREDAGDVIFEGRSLKRVNHVRAAQMGILRSFQHPQLFHGLTALENVALSLALRNGTPRAARIDSLRDKAQEALETFQMGHLADKRPPEMSHGERKILDIVMAFVGRPRLLMLDEPTSGVSTADKWGIMDIVIRNTKKEGITLLVIEHDLDLVFEYAENVIVMFQGSVVYWGPPRNMANSERVREVLGI